MQVKTDLETKRAENARNAAIDAAKRNAARKPMYSNAVQQSAETMRNSLLEAYNTMGVYINYRDNFVAVKVTAPLSVNDRKLLAKCEAAWEAQGVEKVTTAQGIIYRLAQV
jgi:hypothetical protein